MAKLKPLPIRVGAVLGALGVFIAAAPADASLVADGLTYTLTEKALTPTEGQFDLHISGINGPADLLEEGGGRSGVGAFAFNPPANFSSATPPAGFTEMSGGLNSGGCGGHGNFFCFKSNADPFPTAPALPANSTLDFVFDVTLSSGGFAGYDPSFKINWAGSKNNYDLVSKTLTPVTAPAPSISRGLPVLAVGGIWLFGAQLSERNGKRRLLGTAIANAAA
jgi:hypothetical protein